MTWSPRFTEATPAPTSTTTPAPSCPRIAGNSPSGSAPESVNSSVWQMPVALISTITSPAFGPSSRTVVISSGFPAAVATAARTSMGGLLIAKRDGGTYDNQLLWSRHDPPPASTRDNDSKLGGTIWPLASACCQMLAGCGQGQG